MPPPPAAPEERAAGRTLREGWALLAGSFFAIFTAYTTAFMLGPMLDDMARDLGRPVALLGQLAAVTFIPWGIGAPLIGSFSDRYGRKPILLIGLAGLSLSSLAGAFAPSFATLLAFRLATGVFGSCVPPSCIASVGDHFSGRTRANAMAIAGAGIAASLIAGLPGMAFITERAGWRGGFAAIAAVGLAAIAFVAWAFPPGRKSAGGTGFFSGFAWMRASSPWYIIGGNVCERFMLSAFLTYVSVLLIRTYGISLTALSALLTAMAFGTLAGGLAGGPLGGVRARYFWIALLVLSEGVLLIVQFSLGPPLAVAIAAGFLFSMASQTSRPVIMDTLVALAPRSRGAIIGFYATSNQLGQMLGAAVGGLAIAWGGFSAVGWLGLAAGAAGAASYLRIMRRMRPEQLEKGAPPA